jgi:hypothetical protein
MRALILTPAVRQQCRDLATWAERPDNWYRPDRDAEPPGDNPAYVLMLEHGFRAVYTCTAVDGKRFRHLSVSVEGTKYPNEVAAFTIAGMFGFTGGAVTGEATTAPGPDWQIVVDKPTRSIVFVQEVPDAR